VVLCTGFQEGLTAEEAERIGVTALLVKPVPLPRLASTVREALDGAARKG
jgi:DNA-binding NtrC family response regulator